MNDNDISLLTGNSSKLFLLQNREEILEFVQEIINSFDKKLSNYSFSTGLTGIGWSIVSIFKKYNINNQNELLDEFDEIIFDISKENLKLKKFDFLHNGLGGVLYFIERKDISRVRALLDILYESSILYNGHIVWEDNFSSKSYNSKKINLSLSHGLGSIIAILNICCSQGILVDLNKIRLYKLLIFFESMVNINSTDALFPDYIIDGKPTYSSKRLAWCFGDLGILYQLLWASNNIKDKSLFNKNISRITKLEKYSVDIENKFDSCFCHGASGIAYLFYKINLLCKEHKFDLTIKKWLNISENVLAKNNNMFYSQTIGWNSSTNLINGMIGCEFVTKTLKGEMDSFWDRCFLLS